MTAQLRLLVLLTAATFACGTSFAADPLPTLPELLKEYKALGLPFPPKEAKLVRYWCPGGGDLGDGKKVPPFEQLAFEIKPGSKTEKPLIWEGFALWNLWPFAANWDPRPREVKPDPEAFKGIELSPDLALIFAAQCGERGWKELAEALLQEFPKSLARLAQFRKEFNNNQDNPDEDRIPKTLPKILEFEAWRYHSSQLSHPTADRSNAAKYIRELIRRDKNDDTEEMRAMLKSLDLALIPGKGKPGSIEALIDGLVDHYQDPEKFQSPPSDAARIPEGPYLKLLELGFDAVPKLIESMEDDRLTRASTTGFNNFWPWRMRVGDVVGDLIEGLAAEELMRGKNGEEVGGGRLRRLQAWPITKAAAKAWWEKAQKVGEEKYALAHILPPKAKNNELTRVSMHLLRLISAKYPKQLPNLYRKVLEERPDLDSDSLAMALAATSIPVEQKRALLIMGAKHKEALHRLAALTALKWIDQKQFDILLISEIEAFPKDSSKQYNPWECAELAIAKLAIESKDPKIWATLEKVIRRSAIGFRFALLDELTYPKEETRWRTERLRLFAAFLEDAGFRDPASDERFKDSDRIEVRNDVAMTLAALLEMEVKDDPKRTPEEWAKLRDDVRTASKRELGKKE